jgi:hypothetical protein
LLRPLSRFPSRTISVNMARQLGGVRGGLTLEKLASYDDLITDALVDKVSRISAHRSDSGRVRLHKGRH